MRVGLLLLMWATDAVLQRVSSYDCAACAVCETDSATSVLMTSVALSRMERARSILIPVHSRDGFFQGKGKKKSPFSYISACNLSKNLSSSSKIQM